MKTTNFTKTVGWRSSLAKTATIIGFLGGGPTAFATEFRANTTGDWDVGTNWEGNTKPTSFARVSGGTRNNSIITLDTVETLTGAGGTSDRFIFGQGGTGSSLTIVSGGSLTTTGTTVHRLGQSSAFTTTVQSGGTLNVQNADVSSAAGSSLIVTGGDLDFGKSFTLEDHPQGPATIEIVNSTATFDIGNNLTMDDAGSTLDFTFDSAGVTPINVTNTFTINAASLLVVDGSSFTGGMGTYELVNYGSRSGSFADPANITITGLSGASIQYDADSMNLVIIPEPATLLGLLGFGVAALLRRPRRKVRAA